jgi:hypothetical protein
MMYKGWIFTLAAAPVLLLTCTCSTDNITGNGSQTGNPAVVGVLYQADGTTPAVGVRVHIRSKKTLADTSTLLSAGTSGTGLSKRAAVFAATDSVVTDSTGRYTFDTTLDTGTYVVEAASGNNAVLIDSVAVKNKAATDTLAPDTLKPAGALKGVIKLSEGGDPRKVFVLAFGIDRFVKVSIDGSFKFAGLAEAAYDLRLISSLDNYGVLDTVGVPVRSGDTTDLDTISLPFTGIPTPKNVRISYDTLKQIVTLNWSKADTSLVKSYNVYRRNVDSNTVLARINTSPIVDTVYRDSTGVQDQTYEYEVVAVSKSDVEGNKSSLKVATFVGLYQVIDSISVPFSSGLAGIAISSTGSIFGVRDRSIREYDPVTKATKNTWAAPDSAIALTSVAWVNDSVIVLAEQHALVKFSMRTGVINRWNVIGEVGDVAATDSAVYFVAGSSPDFQVCKLGLDSGKIDTVLTTTRDFAALGADLIQGIATAANSLVFAVRYYTNGGSATMFNAYRYDLTSSQSHLLATMPWGPNQNPSFAVIGDTVLMSTANTGRLIVSGEVASWSLPQYTSHVTALDTRTLYVAGGYPKVYKYTRK